MEGRELAELKDKILRYLKDNGKSREFDLYHLFKKDVDSYDDFKEVTLDMFRHHNKYFKMSQGIQFDVVDSGKILDKTAFTEQFLNDGGFTGIYDEIVKNEADEKKVKEASNLKIVLDARFWWLPYFISAVAASYVIASYYKPQPKNNDEQLKQMEQRMDYIEGTLHMEVDSLKNELYKADVLIDAYESEPSNVD